MRLSRHFTTPGQSPYIGIEFKSRESRITKLDGTVVFEAKDVRVPDSWDQTATDILAQKYFRRRGCDFTNPGSVYKHTLASSFQAELPNISNQQALQHRQGEWDLRQTIHRIVGCMTTWGQKLGYFPEEGTAQTFYDELSRMMVLQMWAPNSPQWFNTGLSFAYGITGPAHGHYYVDPTEDAEDLMGDPTHPKARPSTDDYFRPQSSACFISSLDDDLVGANGIMDLALREARLFKYGSGSGTNFSKLRGKNEPLSGGGVSSGLMSFLKIGDICAGSIKSGGTSRRAAKMVILNVDHPDIEDFINWKVIEERKAAMLVAGSKSMVKAWTEMVEAYLPVVRDGASSEPHNPKLNLNLGDAVRRAHQAGVPLQFIDQCIKRLAQGDTEIDIHTLTLDWESEAYTTISSQNANNSVRVTDAFMEAVLTDGDWDLTARTTGKVLKTVKARALWDQIVRAAWMCADPGIQFHDTYNRWHTGAATGPINATNPCSEYAYLDDTACNLASINLCAFLDSKNNFDVIGFQHACSLVTIALEITVAMSHYPSAVLAQNSYDHRPLGLGYANLGSLLMRQGIPYDSALGRSFAGALASVMTGTAYDTSIHMSAELNPYPAYEVNREHMLAVLQNHADEALGTSWPQGLDTATTHKTLADLHKASTELWKAIPTLAATYGVRNAQVTVIAPTGTIGLVMGCDTTGVEPDYALVKFKKLAGGGNLKLVNGAVPAALKTLGFSQQHCDDIIAYVQGEGFTDKLKAPITYNSLLGAGYTKAQIAQWNEDMFTAFDPRFVLPVSDLQEKFGSEKVAKTLEVLSGTGSIEGAPHIRAEHLPVFDCASVTGRLGTRSISPEGHLKMMAAVQPFISGSISKTVNLPATASIADVGDTYMKAWQWGIKALSIYRDGSKFSQPLSSNLNVLEALGEATSVHTKAEAVTVAAARAIRQKLPGRRLGYTQAATIGGNKVYMRTGEYEDGELGEIFLDIHKEGATLRAMLNSFAISVSIGLQYGVPLGEYVDAFCFSKFEPHGIVKGHDMVKMCTSLLDYIFRDLAITYLDRHDLANVKPEELMAEIGPRKLIMKGNGNGNGHTEKPKPAAQPTDSSKEAVMLGFTGDPCSICGHLTLVRSGTCLRCTTCGGTTGCS